MGMPWPETGVGRASPRPVAVTGVAALKALWSATAEDAP
jgi:hypothetical protein